MTDDKPTWEELYQAAEDAAKRAHEAIDDIAGWSGSAGNWPLQEASTAIKAVLAAFRAPPYPQEKPMSEFKPGSIVTLKSGGPKMTILRNKTDGGFFDCMWFDANLPQNSSFHEDALEPIDPDQVKEKLRAEYRKDRIDEELRGVTERIREPKFKVEALALEAGWPQRLEARLNEIKDKGYAHLEVHLVPPTLGIPAAVCIIHRPV